MRTWECCSADRPDPRGLARQPCSQDLARPPQRKPWVLCTNCYDPFENLAGDLFEFADLELAKCHLCLKKVPHTWCIFQDSSTLCSPRVFPGLEGVHRLQRAVLPLLTFQFSELLFLLRSFRDPPFSPGGSPRSVHWGFLPAVGSGPCLADVTTERGQPPPRDLAPSFLGCPLHLPSLRLASL